MAGNGYIKLYRKMADWGWYTDANTMRVFLHLLLIASYEDNTFRGHRIRPGQAVIGRRRLAQDLGISEQAVRTALNHLKSTNEITIKLTNKFSIVTIVNWASYQGYIDEDNQQNNQPAHQRATNNQPHSRNKEGKKKEGGRPRSQKQELEDTYAMLEEWAKT